jgi:hypothetical protein
MSTLNNRKAHKTDSTPNRDVIAGMTYIVPQEAKPRFYSQAYTGAEHIYDFDAETVRTRIKDMRKIAGTLRLDTHGFALLAEPTGVLDLDDDATVETLYYDEVKRLVARELGASSVVVFDATRRSDGGNGAANPDGKRTPATRIHVDYTEKSGPERARAVLGDERYERLLAEGNRIVQVNVWRPIKGPVKRSPLALADASSVAAQDLVATDQVFPDRVGEIYHLAANPAQRWYYAPEMERDEALIIKGWDSLNEGQARFTPHAAFTLPDETASTPARHSIEVRTFAVIPPAKS